MEQIATLLLEKETVTPVLDVAAIGLHLPHLPEVCIRQVPERHPFNSIVGISPGWEGILWAVIGAMALLLMNLRLSPRLVLRMYGAHPLSPEEASGLFSVLQPRDGLHRNQPRREAATDNARHGAIGHRP